MTTTEHVKRYLLLTLGIFLIGLGIAFAKHSEIGISPVSSVANVLSLRFPRLTVGNWITVWNCTLILCQILLLRRAWRPVQFLQIVISLFLGVCTDFWVWVISPLPRDPYLWRLFLVVLGDVVLSFGVTLTVIADKVMNVGEAFVAVLAKQTGHEFSNVKLVFDISCVTLAVVLSLVFFRSLSGTREGTLIAAVLTGVMVKIFTPLLKPPLERWLKQ